MTRPTRDESLMSVAKVFESRASCSRNHVGCVIAKDGRILSTGYNGAPAGMPHCDHGYAVSMSRKEMTSPIGLRMSPVPLLSEGPGRGCRIAIHAEANALAFAARHGLSVEGAELFTTLSPCYECAKLIIAAGLVRVVFDRGYRDPAGTDLLQQAGLQIEVIRVP